MRGGDAVASLWRTLFVGCKGIIGFHDLSIYNPDWTWSAGYRDVKSGMDRIDIGVGKHLISNLKMSRPVAILYSQASIRAAFYENRADEVAYLKALEYPKEPRNAALIAAEQDRLERAFERAGVNPPRIALADATDGRRFRLANVYPREGRGGALFWGVISEEKSARLMNVTFPKRREVRQTLRLQAGQ